MCINHQYKRIDLKSSYNLGYVITKKYRLFCIYFYSFFFPSSIIHKIIFLIENFCTACSSKFLHFFSSFFVVLLKFDLYTYLNQYDYENL